MKKSLWVILLVLLMTASLIGCGEQQTLYEVESNGMVLQVDIAQKTISDGQYLYHYKFSGNASSYHMTITYPDGSSYWWSGSESGGAGGWSDDYSEGTYVRGLKLVEAVEVVEGMHDSKPGNPGEVLVGLILIALGVFELVRPQVLWNLRYGWQYKNAEPSDAALMFARIGGIIVAVIGIVLLLS